MGVVPLLSLKVSVFLDRVPRVLVHVNKVSSNLTVAKHPRVVYTPHRIRIKQRVLPTVQALLQIMLVVDLAN